MVPADYGVDGIFHHELQLKGALVGPGSVIFTAERGGA